MKLTKLDWWIRGGKHNLPSTYWWYVCMLCLGGADVIVSSNGYAGWGIVIAAIMIILTWVLEKGQ